MRKSFRKPFRNDFEILADFCKTLKYFFENWIQKNIFFRKSNSKKYFFRKITVPYLEGILIPDLRLTNLGNFFTSHYWTKFVLTNEREKKKKSCSGRILWLIHLASYWNCVDIGFPGLPANGDDSDLDQVWTMLD